MHSNSYGKFLIINMLALFAGILLVAVPAQALTVDDVFPKTEKLFDENRTTGARLPGGDFKQDFVPQAIKIMLAISGTLAFIAFTVGGVMLVVAQGNEDVHTKAKNIFIYAIIALAVIAGSYGIVYGILTLRLQ